MSEVDSRHHFIDQFRGWALLVMVETHVLRAFLSTDLRSSPGYKALDIVNGLVAPSFLFVAGFSFAILAERRWDDFLHLGKPFWKQCGRCLQILAIGYLLHVPRFSLRQLPSTLHWNERHVFWGVDVLHCIALSLLLMTLLVPLWRKPRRYYAFLAVAAVAVSLLTPLVFSMPLETLLPAAVSGYLKRQPFSQFPLFPWMAYVWLGAFFSWLWQGSRRSAAEERYFRLLPTGGAALVAVFFIAVLQPLSPIDMGSLNPARPLIFFLKLGLVMMLFSFQWHLDRKWGNRPSWVNEVGRESLLAYAAHIAVIYGGYFGHSGHSLNFLIGKTRSWAEVATMALLLILATILPVIAWRRLKANRPGVARRVLWAGSSMILTYMMLRS